MALFLFNLGVNAELKQNCEIGKYLGVNYCKIRLGIAFKGKGKLGRARIVTCFQISDTRLFLLAIFDKSKQENITDKELTEI